MPAAHDRSPAAELATVVVFAAFIAVLGIFPGLYVGGSGVPIVLQNIGPLLAGAVLGARRGTAAVLLLLALTALGLPLLSGGRGGIDPFVGLRARLDLTDNFYVLGRGDVGGFGVGSDFVWNANLGIGFEITDNIDIAGGYRWLDYDFEEGDFKLDLQFAGPWIGIFFKF